MGRKFPKFSMARLVGAMTLASLGLGLLVVAARPNADLFETGCALSGACFGETVGLIVGRPMLLSAIGAGLFMVLVTRAFA